VSKLKQGLLFVGVAIFALVAGIFLRAQFTDSNQSPPLTEETKKTGAEAIFAASLPDISGESQAISQWRGNVLIVNFWATWCAPCQEEIPEFIEMQETYGDQGLLFIGIAIDREEMVVAFSEDFGINYPVLIEAPGASSLLEATGNPQAALPYTLVINRDGEIVETYLGRVHQEKLEKVFKPLLQAKSE
jgi:thiol-disulfide isomerase/thioredoxin